jgi:formate-dependent nitrite reductase membrane component NrfD
MITELTITHPTTAAKSVVEMITKGRYKNIFWIGTVLIGNIIPLALVFFNPSAITIAIAGALVLVGIYATEKIWVEAPQRVPLA